MTEDAGGVSLFEKRRVGLKENESLIWRLAQLMESAVTLGVTR